ncbi:ATPase involved in DNA repair [[Eubacterium] contortum]|uniref:ATPase involved in DNA repair n=1 Tax=Faecalicatena contorta TaxID=39482 RepID=A0A174LUQ5_9FIRM|nr:hypothetical protein [Faecalicatena contorta]CUP25249.1 ATPase involved in DNA repair [[Eubacterium] contortum] [Faecalicatena contorta]
MDIEKLRVILEMEKKNYSKELEKARKETKQATDQIEAEMEKVKQSTGKMGYGLDKSQVEIQSTMQKMRDAFSAPLRAIQALREKMAMSNPNVVKTDEYENLQAEIEKTEAKIKSLKREQLDLMDSGKGRVLTAEYKEIAKCVSDAEKRLNSLLAKEEKFRSTGGNTRSRTYKTLMYDIEEARNTLGAYKADLNDIEENGVVSEHSAAWKKLQSQIDEAKEKLKGYNTEQAKMESEGSAYTARGFNTSGMRNASGVGGKFKKIFSGLKNVFSSITTGIKKASGAFGALIQKFATGIPIIKRFTGAVNKNGNAFGGGLFKVLKYSLGIRSLFVLTNRLRGALVNGFKNLAQYSDQTNASLSMLMSSLTQLKNAFATAFAPILEVVAPLLNTLIQKVTQAVSAIGMLFSSLTGKSYFTSAKKVNQDYAASLNQNANSANEANEANKELQRTLLGFDQINKLDDDTYSAPSGGTPGVLDPSDMFEEAPIGNKIKEFADKLKDAWRNADFTEIGQIVADKLNHALENIPWGRIRATLNRIAKSIATFLNGFLERMNWELVGDTIAQGLNTAFEFVNTFVKNFHWDSLGKAIGKLINGACNGLNWDLIHGTLKGIVEGITTSIRNILDTADPKLVGNTLGNYIHSFILIGYTAVTTFPWAKLGKTLGECINGAIEKIDLPMLGTTIGKLITGIFSLFRKLAGTIEWDEVGKEIATGLNNMFKELDPDEIAEGINNVVNGLCEMLGTFLKEVDWGELFGKIVEIWNKLDWKVKLGVTALVIGKALFGALGLVFKSPALSSGLAEAFGGSIATALKAVPMALAGAAGIGFIGFNIFDVFKDMRESIKNKDIFGIVDSIKGFFSLPDIPNSMNAGIKKALDAVGFYDPIREKFADCKEWLIDKGVGTIEGLISGIENKYPDVQAFFKGLPGDIKAQAGNAGSWLLEKGRSAIDGLKSGYESKIGTFFSKVQRLKDETFFAIGDLLGKVRPKGGDIASGLTGGFNDNKKTLLSTISNIPDLIKSGLGDLGTIGRNAIQSFANGFSSVHIPMPHIGMDWSKVTLGKTSFSIPNFRLSWYAAGGFPDAGEMFVARENGPEMVGRMGNRNAVANNGQIVEGIKKGVYDAVVSAFSQFKAGDGQEVNINVYLGTKQVTDVFIEDINNRTISTGVCPIRL